jgi:hypothetical protein
VAVTARVQSREVRRWVNRLRTDQKVVVGSRGPETTADESHSSPHFDSRIAALREAERPPGASELGFQTWSLGLKPRGVCSCVMCYSRWVR